MSEEGDYVDEQDATYGQDEDNQRYHENSNKANVATDYRSRSRSASGSPMRDSSPPLEQPRKAVEPLDDDETARNNGTNLFVSGLAKSVTEPDLHDFFETIGRVSKVQIMLDPHTRESRGFAFVELETSEEAEKCLSDLDGKDLQGKVIAIDRAKRSKPRAPTPGKYFGPPKARNRGGRRYNGGGGRGYRRDYDRGNDRGPPRDRGYRDREPRDSYDREPRDRGYDRYDRYRERDPPRDRYDREPRDRGYDRGYDRYDDRYDDRYRRDFDRRDSRDYRYDGERSPYRE